MSYLNVSTNKELNLIKRNFFKEILLFNKNTTYWAYGRVANGNPFDRLCDIRS